MKRHMIRPAIYLCAGKWAGAAAFALVWDRFFNPGGRPLSFPFAALTAVFAGLAWMRYLKLDGVSIHHLFEEKRERPKKHPKRDIVDYADEKLTSLADLEEDERVICRLASDGAAALFCLVLAVIF